MKISDPWIAKEKFNNISKVQNKLAYNQWVEFIEAHKDYFIWIEDTEEGKNTIAKLNEVPESFKEKILKGHNKKKALAEFNSKKGFYEVVVQFNERIGIVGTTFQKKIKKHHLEMLLEMAEFLDAHLLNNGTQIIDRKTIESLS